jgi:hypothetical protein
MGVRARNGQRSKLSYADGKSLPRFSVPLLIRPLALRGGRETWILSRNQNNLGKKFPEITSSIAALAVQDAIIGGEIHLVSRTPWERREELIRRAMRWPDPLAEQIARVVRQ